MKIYTKKGDQGYTSLLNSGKDLVSKSDARIEAYGTIDELNSWIGLISDEWTQANNSTHKCLREIQNTLFILGSHLAIDTDNPIGFDLPNLPNDCITNLEHEIDRMEVTLKPLTNFILPTGHKEISHIHIARTVCRRAERKIISVSTDKRTSQFIIYINRLGDFLFTLARYKAKLLGVEEILWTH